MALDTLKFVDSIASSPTTRLDLNDGSLWYVREFYAPPPRLRRSLTTNAMTDGAYATSSTYDSRVITIRLDLISTTEDINATELQKLARELDRSTNFLQYKPDGATSPVFFRTERADFSELVDFNAALAYRQLTIEIVAEPFALGLRETISAGTVRNDPAAANGHYIDVTGVKGDVTVRPTIGLGTSIATGDTLYVASYPNPSGSATVTAQAESYTTIFAGTANPGGGPDAAMSGTGTNNYLRTTFAGSTLVACWQWQPTTVATREALRGTWRAFVAVRRSDNTSVINVQAAYGAQQENTTPLTALTLTTARHMVDLGLVSFSASADKVPSQAIFTLYAQRVSGTATLDWDYVLFMPADYTGAYIGTPATTQFNVLDSEEESVYGLAPAVTDLFTGNGYISDTTVYTGRLPNLRPNVTNRLYYAAFTQPPTPALDKSKTSTVTVYYYPLYLYVRPATT